MSTRFENIDNINHNGLELNKKFHNTINGIIGYMSAYLEKYDKPPIAISYFNKEPVQGKDDAYFYLTRRQYEYEQDIKHNLVCIGGPDHTLKDRAVYVRND